MSRDPTVYLQHIQLCLERIASYTAEGREAFFVDTRTQDAVVRNLEIIGQAVKDLGVESLTRQIPELAWHEIAGMRNVLAHQYLGVDIQLVWNVIEQHVPALRAAVDRLLAAASNSHQSD